MDLPDALAVFHQPVRLRIMGLLYKQRDASFTRVRDLLCLTDGNLASHGKRLADAGHIEMRRVLTQDGFESRLRITRAGARAFRSYLDTLRGFLDEHEVNDVNDRLDEEESSTSRPRVKKGRGRAGADGN